MRFDGATFRGTASFRGAIFCDEAFFEQEGDEPDKKGRPEEVTFTRWADFRSARFDRLAHFGGAVFERRARFGDATFGADARFVGARFQRARTLGPLRVERQLVLDRALFEAPVRIEAIADEVCCVHTQFMGRTSIELCWANLDLKEAEFAQPSIVSCAEVDEEPPAPAGAAGRDDHGRSPAWKPGLTSLRRANVGNLTLADLDMRECEFSGAHNLDRLRFEGGIDLVPSGRLRARRRTIAEEHALSEKHGLDRMDEAVRTARSYRALRKGREDNKDEPGAADFYFGEMEMRRKAWRRPGTGRGATATSWPEWVVLSLYWLVSGYGLRAIRALAALVVTILAFAVGFDLWPGFEPDQDFGQAVLFSAESTTSLFRTPELSKGVVLTDAGRGLQMGIRLLGPLFFGLALLALRGRVKR